MKCHLVEDDIATQFVLKTQLNQLGYELSVYSDVSELEEIVHDAPNQLENAWLLMDINLPIEDGDAFLLRKKEALLNISGLKVVLLQESETIPNQLDCFNSISACNKANVVAFIKNQQP